MPIFSSLKNSTIVKQHALSWSSYLLQSKKAVVLLLLVFAGHLGAMEDLPRALVESTNIVAPNIDELVVKGVQHINENGERFESRAGSGKQAYDVTYVLTNPYNRAHELRGKIAKRYFARELLAYFRGSLEVDNGLAQASKIWKSLADENGKIASNYGHYVFHQKLDNFNGSQYEWVIQNLLKNLDSRKAFININQPHHKDTSSKDFPCTLGMQFFVLKKHLCTTVSSRSTDIFTGLPYDMGFFSFVHELVYEDLKERLEPEKAQELKLGPVKMKASFTQIYDTTSKRALALIEKQEKQPLYSCDMPQITNAKDTLEDIYKETTHTDVMKWIKTHAEL